MANFNIDYTNDSDYTFDTSKIEIVNGVAKLKYREVVDATFGANYSSSINAIWGEGVLTGNQTGGVVVTNGKLDLTGGTSVKYIDYNADLNADSQQVGCIRFKLTPNYSGSPSVTSYQAFLLICQESDNGTNEILLYQTSNGAIQILIKDYNGTTIFQTALATWSPVAGTEYEFELNYDLTNGATRLFIDGQQFGATQTGTGVRDGNIGLLRIGATAGVGSPWCADFYIDDLIIFSTVQHTANYTKGYTVLTQYADDFPTIYKTNGDTDLTLVDRTLFTETLGNNNSGNVRYQISSDGSIWQYWNGSSWENVSSSTDYNSYSEINTAFVNETTVSTTIYVKAFLISDGTQQVELDNNQIGYTTNTAPNIYCGTDKDVVYNTPMNPFSDCSGTDLEDNCDKVEWKEDGGTYAVILQGGTKEELQQATHAFSYTPIFSNTKILWVRVTDIYGAIAEDYVTLNMKQVNVTINVKDINGNHLSNVSFDAGDSSASSIQNSPFLFTYDIGTFSSTVSKTYFDSLTQTNTINISTTLIDYIMDKETSIDDLIMNIDTKNEFVLGDTFKLDGTVNINLTNYKIRCSIKDISGNLVSLGTSNTGGSDSEIDIYNPASGNFMIICAKDLTTDFDNDIYLTIELENPSGQVRTMIDKKLYFKTDRLTWTDASED